MLREDPLLYHRLALAPISANKSFEEIVHDARDLPDFFDFLVEQGLAPIWFNKLHQLGCHDAIPTAKLELLARTTRNTAALNLLQDQLATEIEEILAPVTASAFFKGVAIRQLLYHTPEERPAADLDILIPRMALREVIEALMCAGWKCVPHPKSIHHELAFTHPHYGIELDVHWQPFHPARLRADMCAELLESRVCRNGIHVLSAEHECALSLSHPYATNYLFNTFKLIRLVDQIQWVNMHLDWDIVERFIRRHHLDTLSWLAKTCAEELTLRSAEPNHKTYSPSAWKQRYYRSWIRNRWGEKLTSFHHILQFSYTLPLSNSITDAFYFSLNYLKEVIYTSKNLEEIAKFTCASSHDASRHTTPDKRSK